LKTTMKIALGIVLVLLIAGCGALIGVAANDDGAAVAEAVPRGAAGTEAETPAPAEYADLVERPVTRLSQSATSVGQVLATAARPRDIVRLRTVVRRQLKVVQANRRVLAGKEIAAADRAAHNRLLRAAALHKRFLELLVRTTALPPAGARKQIPGARSTAARALSFYHAFFRQTPELPNLVSDTGLADLSGLRTALAEQEAINEAKARMEPQRGAAAPPVSPPASASVPSAYSGPFSSYDGLERCYATDLYVTCTARPSGKGVRLTVGQGPEYLGITGSSDQGGIAMAMGTSFRTPAGTIQCLSDRRGITCNDLTDPGSFTIGDYVVRINYVDYSETF
jgi:hypothetical protein